MKILIAPDKFKGSLSAREVAENIAAGLRDVLPGAKIDMVPMADGGEGTAEVIGNALDGDWVNCAAHDPLGREIDARYVWIEHRKFAVMEVGEGVGMRGLSAGERDPLRANTFGVGEMLIAAARRGADQIIIGLGGSATNDGGFGMARALGFRFFEQDKKEGQELRGAVSELTKLARIDRARNLSLPKIVAVIITGEGSLDAQTLQGKTPAGVARLARKLGKRVFAIVGRASEDRQVQEIFDGVYELTRPSMSEQENMARAAEFLRKKARELAKKLSRR